MNSLQLTSKHAVATPVNWTPGEDVIIAGSVSDEQARQKYPEGWKAPRPYLRSCRHPRRAQSSGGAGVVARGSHPRHCFVPLAPCDRRGRPGHRVSEQMEPQGQEDGYDGEPKG